ncbi:hypothetical protein ANCDUO_14068 [Ancylostoma duodenale]|uniref:Uncharacterized protein n=1 Tax=Ancylostoma duodenale TaxID=51022 RepID=A0A0C2CHB9_9BILA|nr:hypothetical protein ANCDUO_14068 [Ancylostoma duodenale]
MVIGFFVIIFTFLILLKLRSIENRSSIVVEKQMNRFSQVIRTFPPMTFL